ncbi:hypothetical protein Aco03nite_027400 [Actinoplanes couchii]|uniref:Uncharacterized protein n=1 Tax=Actinoplanes couchii TaxID=403638 RepID=A0ABQ3X750_9ACTN|nr:hypothetical protein Aco03nite_027400 [Actinoplanes couchii]
MKSGPVNRPIVVPALKSSQPTTTSISVSRIDGRPPARGSATTDASSSLVMPDILPHDVEAMVDHLIGE